MLYVQIKPQTFKFAYPHLLAKVVKVSKNTVVVKMNFYDLENSTEIEIRKHEILRVIRKDVLLAKKCIRQEKKIIELANKEINFLKNQKNFSWLEKEDLHYWVKMLEYYENRQNFLQYMYLQPL